MCDLNVVGKIISYADDAVLLSNSRFPEVSLKSRGGSMVNFLYTGKTKFVIYGVANRQIYSIP